MLEYSSSFLPIKARALSIISQFLSSNTICLFFFFLKIQKYKGEKWIRWYRFFYSFKVHYCSLCFHHVFLSLLSDNRELNSITLCSDFFIQQKKSKEKTNDGKNEENNKNKYKNQRNSKIYSIFHIHTLYVCVVY